jgi:succinate dehydrogenase/fumarate reductase flavoprotein subunit
MNLHEYIKKTGKIPEWAYPVEYGKQTDVDCDVLVVGGGVAGCRAAIAARQREFEVVLMDRGVTKRSGMGGVGVDHWHGAVKNPCSKITPKMYSDIAMYASGGYTNGLARYIIGSEGWDTLLELESWGVQIRDEEDEFKGTMWRDEETKLLFAYDVENKHCLRVYGYNIKPVLDKVLRRLGVKIYNRTCVTSLLTEGGKQGARCIGATGLNDRTGEFLVFNAKSVVVATGGGGRLWGFAPEVTMSASMSDLNNCGLGHAIGWNAGAEFVMMDQVSNGGLSGFGYAPYSTGNSDNTYQGAPMVDRDYRRIQHATVLDKLIDLEDERGIFMPEEGASCVLGHGIGLSVPAGMEYEVSHLDPGIGDKVRGGELKLPLYTDLTLLSREHNRLIWGLMLSHEGKCRVPIYETMTKWGFDPERDVLQLPVTNPDNYYLFSSWCGINSCTPPNWRQAGCGGYLTDWRLQSSLPGLFVAGGMPLFGSGCHGESHTTGRYAGRQAAVFAKANAFVKYDAEQAANEKARVLAPALREDGDVGWKEMNYAIARIMQDYCGEIMDEHTLELGVKRLEDLRDTEGGRTFVNNPHELARLVECFGLIDLGVCYIESAKARKASSDLIGFKRIDYPEVDPEEWHKFIPICLKDGAVSTRDLPCDYYLNAPYAPDLEENYQAYAELGL